MARRKFYRNTITLVVYTEDTRLSDHTLSFDDIEQIIAECMDGSYIGDVQDTKTRRVKTMKKLRKELVKIGNDGTFFDLGL